MTILDSSVRTLYDQKAASWQSKTRLIYAYTGGTFERLLNLMDSVEEGALLDIGCGTAKVFLRSNCYWTRCRYIGLDISEPMVRQATHCANGHSNARFVVGSAESAPFRGDSFDCVTALMVLHQLADPAELFAIVRTLLKPRGRFLIEVNGPEYLIELFPSHLDDHRLGRFVPEQVLTLAADHGFMVEAWYSDTFQYVFETSDTFIDFMDRVGAISKYYSYTATHEDSVRFARAIRRRSGQCWRRLAHEKVFLNGDNVFQVINNRDSPFFCVTGAHLTFDLRMG